jgi:hypothetical protein
MSDKLKIKIWKYEIPYYGFTATYIPKGAKPLCVANQDGKGVIWFEFDPDYDHEERWIIHSIMTNQEVYLSSSAKYIGSILFNDDSYVAHVYAEKGE